MNSAGSSLPLILTFSPLGEKEPLYSLSPLREMAVVRVFSLSRLRERVGVRALPLPLAAEGGGEGQVAASCRARSFGG